MIIFTKLDSFKHQYNLIHDIYHYLLKHKNMISYQNILIKFIIG